jgi:phage baseplate assembly protein W
MTPDVLAPSKRGLTYPLTIVNGNLTTSTDYSLIAQQVRSVVDTRYYERVMRSDYGVNDYTLSVMNPSQINSDFQAAITQYVPDLSGVSVKGDWLTQGDEGVYKMIIEYSVNGIPQPPIQYTLAN